MVHLTSFKTNRNHNQILQFGEDEWNFKKKTLKTYYENCRILAFPVKIDFSVLSLNGRTKILTFERDKFVQIQIFFFTQPKKKDANFNCMTFISLSVCSSLFAWPFE